MLSNELSVDRQIEEKLAAIEALKNELQELQRRRPHERVRDYVFKNSDGSDVALHELFGEKDDLLLIHNMGGSCPYCTLWADGFNGVADHLADRAAFVLVSPDHPEAQRKFAESRGWKFRTASCQGSTFSSDMGFENEPGNYWPGVSAFRKEGDEVYRTNKAIFGPGDDFCAVWPLFDLLNDGAKGWEPKYRYDV